ncbi:MAG TPA: LPXTG cell wall anchor domain-containing protein [Acidimicrobiia bacterium]|nr:LPXTG cell wall anchor domain-containing protein [Acidimicrobiia bacterium]
MILQQSRRLAGLVVALLTIFAVMLVTTGVNAQDASIEIPLPTVVRDGPGSQHLLADQEVPTDLVGMSCTAQARAENQSSVHPGNNLVIASGGQEVVLEDVERAPGAVTTAEGSLILGERVTVTLVMGEDGVFSAGMSVELTCAPAESTTTTMSGPTTTVPETTSSTVLGTTITTAPPTTEEPTTTMADTTSSTVLGTTITTSPTTQPGEDTTTTDDVLATSPSTLPFTGAGADSAAGIAGLALLAGTGLVLLSRRTIEN